MATPVLNSSFASYTLTEAERLSGSALSHEQQFFIQNLICEAAERKLALQYNPDKPYDFVQQEAYNTGQIEILKWLLENSRQTQLPNQET